MGRASGGLLILHKIHHKRIGQNKHWVLTKMMLTSTEEVILGFLYLSPSYKKYKELITRLQDMLHKISEKDPDLPLIKMGDFKVRIDTLNQVE